MAQRATGKRRRELALAALLLAIPLLFLQANLKSPRATPNFVDRVILRLSAPLEAAATYCLRGATGVWHHYIGLLGVERENEALRSENARLRTVLASESQSTARAAELERLLGFKRALAGETVAAHAIAYQTSGFYRILRLRIDLGSELGAELGDRRDAAPGVSSDGRRDAPAVARGMPVVAADGVVGTIKAAYGDYSDVLLATDPGSGIDVILPRSGARAVLKGMGDAHRAYLDSLRQSDDVRPGDLVVTSGVRPFPKDVPVGQVVRVERPPAGMSQYAEVELAADPSKITDVLVVLPPPAAAEQ